MSQVNKPVVNVTQTFSETEQATARSNIGVYSKAEVDDKISTIKSSHLDMKVDADVVEFFILE